MEVERGGQEKEDRTERWEGGRVVRVRVKGGEGGRVVRVRVKGGEGGVEGGEGGERGVEGAEGVERHGGCKRGSQFKDNKLLRESLQASLHKKHSRPPQWLI